MPALSQRRRSSQTPSRKKYPASRVKVTDHGVAGSNGGFLRLDRRTLGSGDSDRRALGSGDRTTRVECDDPLPALTGFRGYPGSLVAAAPMPGSTDSQPAKRNHGQDARAPAERVECDDPVPALTGFGGYPGGIIAAAPMPGSTDSQPAKRNHGQDARAPAEAPLFTNTLQEKIPRLTCKGDRPRGGREQRRFPAARPPHTRFWRLRPPRTRFWRPDNAGGM
jgi:hypothetical protein